MRPAWGRVSYPLALEELDPHEEVALRRLRDRAVPGRPPRRAYGYAFAEDDRPGRFDAETAERLGVTPGPDFGRLQAGETVNGVAPEQVLGEPRPRPPDRALRRHRALPGDRGVRPRGRPARPRGDVPRRRARPRARDRPLDRPPGGRDRAAAERAAARADPPLDALLPARCPRRGARGVPATRSSRATSTRSRCRSPSAGSRTSSRRTLRHRHEHDRVLPRGGLRPDQQLRRHRRRPAQARPPRRVHRRGVVRRRARGPGLRGAPDAARAAARGARGPRPVLEGLHPRDRAGVPQADDRAARRVHRPDLPGAGRRRRLRRRPPARDHRRARARRDRRGQRRRLPGAARVRAPVGADRLLQPDRGPRPRRAAAVLRLPGRRPQPAGPRTGTSGRARTARCTPRSTRCARSGRAAAARARVHVLLAVAEPDAVSRRGRLPARPPARRHLAQPPDQRPRHRRAVGAAAAARRPRGPARLPVARLARLAPTSS